MSSRAPVLKTATRALWKSCLHESRIVADSRMKWNPTRAKRAAGVLVPLCHVGSDHELSVLFTIRSASLNKHRGEISFPGGLRDAEDENVVMTAIRETKEEIGLQVQEVYGTHLTVPDKSLTIAVTPTLGYLGRIHLPDVQFNPAEVSNVFTVRLERLMSDKFKSLTRFRGTNLTLPEWNVDPDAWTVHADDQVRIWGLTALIMDSMINDVLSTEKKM